MRCWSSTVAFVVISLLKSPSGPELQHEPSELPAGGTKSEYTARRPAGKSYFMQNATHASVVFVSCALASVNAWMLCNRDCNQAVMELCNSMHLVDKNLEIVPYFRGIEGLSLFKMPSDARFHHGLSAEGDSQASGVEFKRSFLMDRGVRSRRFLCEG